MRPRFTFRHRKHDLDLESELRSARPRPSDRLVASIARRVNPRTPAAVRPRTRIALAAAATALMVAAVAASGGLGTAASSVAGAVHVAATVAHVSSPSPHHTIRSSTAPTSAADQYAVAPMITSLDPTAGYPGDTVEVNGSNYTGPSQITDVQLNGTEASFAVDSSTSLHFVVPSGATTGTVTITNGAGSATSGTFTVYQPASITNVAPTEGGAGTAVVITGSGFLGVTKVTFNGKVASFTVASDTEIDTAVPAGAPVGDKTGIQLFNKAGNAQADFTVDSNAPVVSSFTPTIGEVGASVTIHGSHFDQTGLKAYFDNGSGGTVQATITASTATSISTTVPVGAGTGPITVSTDVGQATSRTSFNVITTPSVDSFKPALGVPGTMVMITGSSFTGTTGVSFNGTAAVTFHAIGDTRLSAKVPAGATTGPITVTNGNGAGSPSADDFTVVYAPTISSTDVSHGGYGDPVTITGSHFDGTTKVTFNGKPASFTVVNNTTIDTTVPAGAVTGAGSGPLAGIVVTNAAGHVETPFTVDSTGPTFATFKPAAGPVGTEVTITGKNLDTVTDVSFNGTHATPEAGATATQLKVLVPAGASTGTITVTNPGGNASSKTSFLVYTTPVVVAFDPAYGRSGTRVTIHGTGFAGATEVDFGGVAAHGKPVFNAKTGDLTTTVPSTAVSGAITVVTPGGTGDSGNDAFTIVAKPTVSGFVESEAVAGTQVHIVGTNFVGPINVKFGTKTPSYVHVDSSTEVTATVPAGAVTAKVAVGNIAGTALSPDALPITAVVGFSPKSGLVGAKVTITGTHLAGGTVKFNGTVAASTSATDTRITVNVPSGATTGPITVTTTAGTATASGDFTVVVGPRITSFTSSGTRGTKVTITGQHFYSTRSVKFNGRAASFRYVSDTEIQAVVPYTATTGPITVTNLAGSFTTASNFTVVR